MKQIIIHIHSYLFIVDLESFFFNYYMVKFECTVCVDNRVSLNTSFSIANEYRNYWTVCDEYMRIYSQLLRIKCALNNCEYNCEIIANIIFFSNTKEYIAQLFMNYCCLIMVIKMVNLYVSYHIPKKIKLKDCRRRKNIAIQKLFVYIGGHIYLL